MADSLLGIRRGREFDSSCWLERRPACMGRPGSLDLRERVVAAVHGGMSCEEAAEHYEVSQSSAIRWVRRDRETGSPAALPMGGKRPFALAEQEHRHTGRRPWRSHDCRRRG
jgi:putative transposase